MPKNFSFLWTVPAGALLLLLFSVVAQAVSYAVKFHLTRAAALDIFEIMFWLTPAVGIVTGLSILALRVAGVTGVTRSIVRRAMAFACLDIVAPFVLLILGIVLSGFTR